MLLTEKPLKLSSVSHFGHRIFFDIVISYDHPLVDKVCDISPIAIRFERVDTDSSLVVWIATPPITKFVFDSLPFAVLDVMAQCVIEYSCMELALAQLNIQGLPWYEPQASWFYEGADDASLTEADWHEGIF